MLIKSVDNLTSSHNMNAVKSGRIQVYTGNGKGKTTASLGLALRATGHGMKVKIIQFMKGSTAYGELVSVKKLGIIVVQYGRPDFVDINNPLQVDIDGANEALVDVCESVSSGDWDIVIADEINVALGFKLIEITEVLNMMKKRSESTELIMTGRMAPQEVIDKADLVTEMKEIKHYFKEERLNARKGIEH